MTVSTPRPGSRRADRPPSGRPPPIVGPQAGQFGPGSGWSMRTGSGDVTGAMSYFGSCGLDYEDGHNTHLHLSTGLITS